jgi:hypothetical protein
VVTKWKVWAGLAIFFAATSVILFYRMLDTAVSYTYCSDEFERVKRREEFVQELLRSLSGEITRARLDTVAKRARVEGVFDKDKHQKVVSDIRFIFDDEDRLQEIQFE